MRKLVLDTNIVLDLFVFDEPAARPLKAAIGRKEVDWIATGEMRDELASVLAYEAIAARLAAAAASSSEVLAAFDGHARLVETPLAARFTCRDADDQKFIDLAVAHGAELLSKDKAVLALRRKLAVSQTFVQ